MNDSMWYEFFIDALYKKFPKKSKLTKSLTKLLDIEREAIYRRLRKEVFFSAHEIVKIASTWGISLDEISQIDSEQYSFKMKQVNYLDPSDEEIIFLRQVIQGIRLLRNVPDTEFMDISNKLPRQIIAGYPYLNQFYLFKKHYLYGTEKESVTFSKAIISEEKRLITEEYYKEIKFVPQSEFIFDNLIFEFLVNDIRYFSSINLITQEEKELIKKDLYNVLNYLLDVATHGCYPETQKKVNIYISELNLDTNYNYTISPEANICFVHAFEKLEIYTFNSHMVKNFKSWMQLKKRTSIQISEVDERSRIDFFTKQRLIINSL
jgi:hypothetical protein